MKRTHWDYVMELNKTRLKLLFTFDVPKEEVEQFERAREKKLGPSQRLAKCLACKKLIIYRWKVATTHINKKCLVHLKMSVAERNKNPEYPDLQFLIAAKKASSTGGTETSFAPISKASLQSIISPRISESFAMPEREKMEFCIKTLDFCIGLNIPLSTIRTKAHVWKDYLAYIDNDGVLAHNLPSEQRINKLLKERSEEIDACAKEEFNSFQDSVVNLLLDGWSSVSRNHLLGIVISRESFEWSTNQNLEGESDTGWNNAKIIENIILRLEEKFKLRFGALITDNASQMAKARRLLSKRFPNLVYLPCLAHQVNLMAYKIYVVEKKLLDAAQDMVSRINKSTTLRNKYKKECQARYGTKAAISLKNLAKTRWNSAHGMLCSILRVRGVIENLCGTADLQLPQDFVDSCLRLEEIFRPLTAASLLLQKRNQDLSGAFKIFMELHKGFRALSDKKTAEILLKDL